MTAHRRHRTSERPERPAHSRPGARVRRMGFQTRGSSVMTSASLDTVVNQSQAPTCLMTSSWRTAGWVETAFAPAARIQSRSVRRSGYALIRFGMGLPHPSTDRPPDRATWELRPAWPTLLRRSTRSTLGTPGCSMSPPVCDGPTVARRGCEGLRVITPSSASIESGAGRPCFTARPTADGPGASHPLVAVAAAIDGVGSARARCAQTASVLAGRSPTSPVQRTRRSANMQRSRKSVAADAAKARKWYNGRLERCDRQDRDPLIPC